MTKRILLIVIVCLVVGIGTVNAAGSTSIASQDTVIHGQVQILLPDMHGDIFIEIITESGDLYGFTEFQEVIEVYRVKLGTSVQIIFLEEEIEGFRFCKPVLKW